MRKTMKSLNVVCLCVGILLAISPAVQGKPPIMVGLDADMSSGSAKAGEAIRRGALIAISEINEQGGLLGGRELKLVIKDHHGVPARGIEYLLEFAKEKNLVAVLGGLHSPVILAELKTIHVHKIIMLVPWAAATPIVDNGYDPNYVFRVSVRDQYAGGFLVEQAIKQGYSKLALLLERTGWGRSNEKGMVQALANRGKKPAGVQWFHWGDTDMTNQIVALEEAGADGILMVANAPEGVTIVSSMARRPPEKRVPIFSHWGITGGEFVKWVGEDLTKVRLQVLQTYSFITAEGARAQAVIERYQSMFGAKSTREIFSPVGTVHAYDLIHLLALAIERAGTIDRPKVRDAFEQIESYSGLIREYRPPFTRERHEGLDASDFRLAIFELDGAIIPVE